MKTVHFVFMGVAGCGKTTAAVDLQKHLDCPYAEGDDFHTQTNRDKMGAGIPLTDEDRYPWLGNLRDWMSEQARAGGDIGTGPVRRREASSAVVGAKTRAKRSLCISRHLMK